jgi:hypothetical protein
MDRPESGEPSKTCSEAKPEYRKVLEDVSRATPTFLIVCDEGWCEKIVCTGMYGWAADWLLEEIQGKPYAPKKFARIVSV